MSKFDSIIDTLTAKGLAHPDLVSILRAKERELGPYASDAAQDAAIVEVLKNFTAGGGVAASTPTPASVPASAPAPTPASSSSESEVNITDEQRANLAATRKAIETGFEKKHWKYQVKVLREDYIKYTLSFNADNWRAGIDMVVYAETNPDCCSIRAYLPIRGESVYEYSLCSALAKFNYSLRYGAFQYDEKTGEIFYKYNIRTENGLNPDHFIRMFNIVLSTADDEDYAPTIQKYAVGRFTREEISEMTKRLNDLIKDIQS